MAEATSPAMFNDALVLLGAAVVAVPLFKRLGLGSVLGYLAAGVAVGPHVIGVFTDPGEILHVAELGVVLLLFVIGLELEPARLWAMRRDIFILGTLQIVLTGLVLMLFPLWLGRAWPAALVAGFGLALSSTAIVMQMLEERGDVQSDYGRKAFAILLMQDLAIVPLLAVVAVLAPAPASDGEPLWLAIARILGALAAVIAAGRFLLTPFFRVLAAAGAREIMTAAALLVVIGAAALMTWVGLSPATGAFLAGVLLAESSFRHELEADIEPFRGVLMGLFFMAVGMTVDLGVVRDNWLILLLACASLLVFKSTIAYAVLRLTGHAHGLAVRVGLILVQGGEFGFVLFSTAVAVGVMTPDHASLLVALVTLSMAATPLVVRLAPLLAPSPREDAPEPEVPAQHGSVLGIGFGRFGQLATQLLLSEGIDVTLLDNDPEMIQAASRFGAKVYYGDGTRLDVLRAAGAASARVIAVCTDSRETTTRIVDLVKAEFPLAKLHVRAYDRGHALELLARDVDFQVRETWGSAIAFGRATLEGLGLAPERAAEVEADVRRRDEARLALQQVGGLQAGLDLLRQRTPYQPTPEPLVQPKRRTRALDQETEAIAAGVATPLPPRPPAEAGSGDRAPADAAG